VSRNEARALTINRAAERTHRMATWAPDPTFYPSPRMAMAAPTETFAYVALLNPHGDGKPDALAVLDVDPTSVQFR
jgi:selenium-binding protein 1